MNRYEVTRKASILGILGNLFLFLLKGSIGLATGSQAMIADSANSAGDIFASLMTSIGNKISSEPKDDSHNFGHGKAEYIFSFLIGLSMIVVAFKLLCDAVVSLFGGSTMQFSWLLIGICLITIATKLALYLYTSHLAKIYSNILLDANKKDHRNDCIITTFTLISSLASFANLYWFDGIVGLGISIWIAYTGIRIFIDSYNVLMDISLDENTKDQILDLARNYPAIFKIDDFSSSPVGYQYFVTLTIYVDGNMTTFASHDLANQLELDISKLEKISKVTIHVNPYDVPQQP